MNKQVCSIVVNEFFGEARAWLEARALVKAGYQVTILALHEPGMPTYELMDGFEVRRIPLRLRRFPRSRPVQLIKYLEFVPRFVAAAVRLKPIVCHCHGLHALPVGYLVSKLTGAKVVYDSDELESAFPNPRWFAWASRQVEHFLIRRVDGVVTVCDATADALVKQDGIPRPVVVRPAPEYVDEVSGNRIREQLNLPQEKKIVLYQGGLLHDRKLESLVEAMRWVNRQAVLVFIGSGPENQFLQDRVQALGLGERVYFLDFGPIEERLYSMGSADLGVDCRPPILVHNLYALPQKLFEYIMAEIPVVFSDLPETRRIIHEYGVGEVFDPSNARTFATAINEILGNEEKYRRMKENTKRAKKILNWENESRKLIEIYEELLG